MRSSWSLATAHSNEVNSLAAVGHLKPSASFQSIRTCPTTHSRREHGPNATSNSGLYPGASVARSAAGYPTGPEGTILPGQFLPQCSALCGWKSGNAVCRRFAGQGDCAGADGGFLVNIGMRLIPAGIAALVAGFAFGLALPSGDAPGFLGSQMSEGSRVRVASLGTDVAFVSAVEETVRRSAPPVPLRRRLSFDERFELDSLRVLSSSVLWSRRSRPYSAPAMATETDELTSSVLRTAPLPSRDSDQSATAHPAVGRSAQRVASLTSPPPAGSAKKIRLAALETPKGSSVSPIPTAAPRSMISPRVPSTCQTDAGWKHIPALAGAWTILAMSM